MQVLFSSAFLMAMVAQAQVSPAERHDAITPHIDISEGVGVITYGNSGCMNPNEGTTLVYEGDSKCVNWSNAAAVDFQKGTLGGCYDSSTIAFYHNTGCQGDVYSTTDIPYGCQNLLEVTGGHGSGLITCNY